eukprot:IDg11472t1
MNDLLEEHRSLLELVHKLISKLSNVMAAAKLRKHTPFREKCLNITRLSSTYKMLLSYLQLIEFQPPLKLQSVEDLTPTARQNRDITALSERMMVLNSMTKLLKYESLDLAGVRPLFDTVIEEYPISATCLAPYTESVLETSFKSVVVKLLQELCGNQVFSVFSVSERPAMRPLTDTIRYESLSSSYSAKLSLAERAS